MSWVQLLTLCSLCLQCYLLEYGNSAFCSQINNLEILSFFPQEITKTTWEELRQERVYLYSRIASSHPYVKPVFRQFWCLYTQCSCQLSTRNQQTYITQLYINRQNKVMAVKGKESIFIVQK